HYRPSYTQSSPPADTWNDKPSEGWPSCNRSGRLLSSLRSSSLYIPALEEQPGASNRDCPWNGIGPGAVSELEQVFTGRIQKDRYR
ncbi:MAG: hypothetical protein K8S14_02965, partial [Actinomycetia bacterium]|nr:hypothetical protein [Actinomycetes bacterium]